MAARPEFKEWEHPRDWRGRWIRKGSFISLPGGLRGEVLDDKPTDERNPRIRVRLSDGREGMVPVGDITVEPGAEEARGGESALHPAARPTLIRQSQDRVRRGALVDDRFSAATLGARDDVSVDATFKRMTPQNQQDVAEVYQRGYKMFGDLGVQNIVVDMPAVMKMINAQMAYDTNNDVMYIGPNIGKMSPRESQKFIAQQRNIRQWSHDDDGHVLRVTAAHELGHALDARIGNSSSRYEARMVLADQKRFGASPRRALSVYGSMDQTGHELVAEAFGDVLMNGRYAAPASLQVIDAFLSHPQRTRGDREDTIPQDIDEALSRAGDDVLPPEGEARERFYQRGTDAHHWQVRSDVRRQIETDTSAYDPSPRLAVRGRRRNQSVASGKLIGRPLNTGEHVIALLRDPNHDSGAWVVVRDPATGAQRAVDANEIPRLVRPRRFGPGRRTAVGVVFSQEGEAKLTSPRYTAQTAPTTTPLDDNAALDLAAIGVRGISPGDDPGADKLGNPNNYSHTGNVAVDRIWRGVVGLLSDNEHHEFVRGDLAEIDAGLRGLPPGTPGVSSQSERLITDQLNPTAYLLRSSPTVRNDTLDEYQPSELSGFYIRDPSSNEGFQITVTPRPDLDATPTGQRPLSEQVRSGRLDAQAEADSFSTVLEDMIADPYGPPSLSSDWYRLKGIEDGNIIVRGRMADEDLVVRIRPDRRPLGPGIADRNPGFRPIAIGDVLQRRVSDADLHAAKAGKKGKKSGRANRPRAEVTTPSPNPPSSGRVRAGREVPKEYRDLINKQVDRLGWRYVRGVGGGHGTLYPNDNRIPGITIASTPGEGRAFANFAAQIKRSGGVTR